MTDNAPDFDSTPIVRTEACALASVRRVAAMLNLDPSDFAEGDALPRGWQFILLAADTRRSDIRPDGFPGLGVPLPELGLPRLMLGGRSVQFHRDILIGSTLTRKSRVQSVSHKQGPTGPMAIVTIAHELLSAEDNDSSVVESQTYILMDNQPAKASQEGPAVAALEGAVQVTPDDTLLFQYSALGFNSHKIHIDRTYAREVEGFPDLVVNGGLATLLLTEHFRLGVGKRVAGFTTRHSSPLFCGRPISITAAPDGDNWSLSAFDERGARALDMTLVTERD